MNNTWRLVVIVAAVLMGSCLAQAAEPAVVKTLARNADVAFVYAVAKQVTLVVVAGVDHVAGEGGGASLSGSSSYNGATWTAIVTLIGSVGASTSGHWSIGIPDGCSITSGTSCSFSLGGIPKRTGSVTYTDGGSLGSININKP